MQYKLIFVSAIFIFSCSQASYGKDLIANAFSDAFKNGTPSIDFRLRYENALQDPLKDSKATTLRTTLGFETADFYHATLEIEMVDVASFFGQKYNPGVSDLNKPTYSLIQDPRGAGLTVAQFSYNGIDKNYIKLGRQYIQLDNERFIGKNDLRQYPQSFDAFGISNNMLGSLSLYYAYLTVQNTNISNGRSANGRHSLDSQIFHVDWSGYQYGNIVGYVYLNKDRTITTNSNTTFGFRVTANQTETKEFDYTLEFARQQSKFDNPVKYTAHYMLLSAAKTVEMFTGTIATEMHSGSANGANMVFITPMGSNDNFNGLAQVFTTPPNRGLQDSYATLSATHNDITLAVTYHYFALNKGPGSKRAGQELDISAQLALNEQMVLSAVFAKYDPQNNVAPKTRRIWIMLNANLL